MVDFPNKQILPFLTCGLISGLAVSAPGCEGVGDLLETCGLACNNTAFIEGSAAISGLPAVDAFFGAALDVESVALTLNGEIRAELDAIAVSVGLEPGAGGAEIAGAVNAQFAAALEGGISIEFKPPRCEASFEVTASAAAECDVEVDPGMVSVSCQGSCEVEAGVEVDCGAEAMLMCTGTAPDLNCEGSCSGTCTVDVSAGGSCEGTCNGTCDGNCSLTDADGNCKGECDAMCTGQCDIEMEAGATCMGKCGGECTYTPPEAMCDASASASCEAMGDASVECSGSCEGSIEEPSVSAECKATVEAKAEANVECFPPELAITFQFAASVEGDIDAKAEFNAWLEGFKGHLSALLALRAKGDIVIGAISKLSVSGEAAVTELADTLTASADIKASAGGICAIANLPAAVSALSDAAGSLSGSVEASASFAGGLEI